MEDKSIFTNNQPQTISEGLQNFIDSMVEEIVLEGKPFDTQKKYLKKFSENEGLDYEAIEKAITELVETLNEMKSTDSKSLIKLALIQAKEAYVSDAVVFSIAQQKGKKEDKNEALSGIIQSSHDHAAKIKLDDPIIGFDVNGVKFEMVKVEGGSFWMGAHKHYRKIGLFSKPDNSIPNFDKEAREDEEPPHIVSLSTFYMGETEVPQALWNAVMCTNPSHWKGDNLPVESVSWNDCQEFIRKLNSITGKNFRLPTEAEWEFAARGGNKSSGYKYAGSNRIGSVAWYDGNSGNKTHAVKGKFPNELGLYDMSGNVWEWCSDWYGSSYYSSSPSSNPKGPSSGSYRVLRGGSWLEPAWLCRVSVRLQGFITQRYLGLRLCLPQ